MKTTALFAASSFLLSSLVAAAPVNKRDLVVVTLYTEVYETVYTTTTVWIHPGDVIPQPTTTPAAEFYEEPYSPPTAAEMTSTEAPYVAPAPTSTSSQAPVYVEPKPSSFSSVYVAPPAPTTTQESAPVYTPVVVEAAPEPVAMYTPPAAPISSNLPAAQEETTSYSGESETAVAPSGNVYTAEMTYYDTGLGSCGVTSYEGEDVVAIAHGIMQNVGNSNDNPLCGQTITIEYEGRTHTAKVVDTCLGCEDAAIDCSRSLFSKVAPQGDGRVPGVKWWFNN